MTASLAPAQPPRPLRPRPLTADETTASALVQQYGRALVGRTIQTERVGSYPGGPAKVTELEPDPESPEIVLQVVHPTFGPVGVFGDELVTLLS